MSRVLLVALGAAVLAVTILAATDQRPDRVACRFTVPVVWPQQDGTGVTTDGGIAGSCSEDWTGTALFQRATVGARRWHIIGRHALKGAWEDQTWESTTLRDDYHDCGDWRLVVRVADRVVATGPISRFCS